MTLPDELAGTWISDPTDRDTIENIGNVSLGFDPDGSLKYTIHSESKDQKIFLSCRVEGGMIISTQPTAPREERTAYTIDSNGKLTLWFQGTPSVFVRADD